MKTKLLLIGFLAIAGCKQDSDMQQAASPAYEYFLTVSKDNMEGYLNGITYNWRLTTSDQYVKHDVVTQGNKQRQLFGFYTTLCDAKFEIYTPTYGSKSDLFSSLFSLGKKEIGASDEQFLINLTVPVGHTNTYKCVGLYTSDGDQEGSYLEIMKTEKQFDAVLQKEYVRAWIKFGCKLYKSPALKADLKTGIVIARFYE